MVDDKNKFKAMLDKELQESFILKQQGKKYVKDNLLKYKCMDCTNEFILSKNISDSLGNLVFCPYCTGNQVDWVSGINESLLQELGCFGIGHFE